MISRIGVLVISLCIVLPAEARSAIIPTPDDRAAFATGQLMQRRIDVFQNPGICGIVLERERCDSDLRAIAQSMPNLAAFIANGDLDLYDTKWGDANAAVVSDADWKTNPRQAWLETAGIVSVAGRWPRNPISDLFLTLPLDAMVRNASKSGTYSALIPGRFAVAKTLEKATSSLDPTQASNLRDALLPQLDSIFGVTAFPATRFDDTIAGDVRLGIYSSTFQELLDNPIGLSEPDSRAFAGELLARLKLLSSPSEQIVATRISTTVGGPITDPMLNRQQIDAIRKDFQDCVDTIVGSWPAQRKSPFLLSMLSAQVAYNAAVLKDKNSDAQFRAVIASLPQPAGASDSMKADFRSMTSAAPGDWQTVNTAATRYVLGLMKL